MTRWVCLLAVSLILLASQAMADDLDEAWAACELHRVPMTPHPTAGWTPFQPGFEACPKIWEQYRPRAAAAQETRNAAAKAAQNAEDAEAKAHKDMLNRFR